MQRERDEAVQQLESRTRQLDRAQRDWALERQVWLSWLVGWLVEWLVGWLIGWFVEPVKGSQQL